MSFIPRSLAILSLSQKKLSLTFLVAVDVE